MSWPAIGIYPAWTPALAQADVPGHGDLMHDLVMFMTGSTAALCFVAALLFLRFYKRSKDRLFIFFAGAFSILGVNRIAFLMFDISDEARTVLYAIRFVAFALILYAIIDKNRRPRTP